MKALLSLLMALSAGPVSAAPQTHTLPRPDGSLIHFTLDLAEGDSAGLLVLAQGSGCALAAASNSLATVRQAFPAHTALIVEKVGIVPDTAMSSDCPAEFLDHYTLSQRIDDYQQVLSHLGGTQDIILFGGSEGGLAMEALAARIHPAAAILLSGSVGGTFGEMVLSTVPPEGKSSVAAGFAEARANPDSSTVLSGHNYRFWADILDHRSSDYLEATDTPFLLIHGGRDNAPVQPVRALADRFAAEGRCNLTYWEFPALDHSMVDPAGTSQLQRIARLAAAWAEHPMPAC
ncbi:hypothetical protein [Devosia sp. 63-57]|uniref:alpha/beta hydrolase family protein n=1 Tax=Devosia sp. 63-57 TaxID=1895751 RepID=UPI000A919721|nr:hypothetical protein [Devosia sp. 63-57]